MKLSRIRVSAFRRFRDSVEIDALLPGLNLFAAPNEAGKSTIAEAIRTVFLERHRASTVTHLRPWDEPSASPEVEVDFFWDGREYRLSKRFLGRKRCHLLIDGRALDGAEAEDHLAALMGFRHARKGGADIADMGVPGLLWIRQGEAPTLAARVRHAAATLRDALSDSLGELSSSDGDVVLSAVREARHALLHAVTGAPKGDYAAALRDADALQAEIDVLAQRITEFHHDLDRLAALRAEHSQAQRLQPWVALAQQHEHARERLAEAEGLTGQREQAAARLRQAEAQVAAQQLRVEHLRQQEEAVATRRQVVQHLHQRLESARQALARQTQLLEVAATAQAEAHEMWEAARRQRRRADAQQQVRQAQQEADRLAQRLAQAEAAMNAWRDLDIKARQWQMTPVELKQLVAAEQAVRLAQARMEAAATTLDYDLAPGVEIHADGQALSGRGRHSLAEATSLHLPGLGTMRVLPGGAELDSLRAVLVREQAALAAALQTYDVADVGAAQVRMRQADQYRAQADASQQVLGSYAPEGLEALARDQQAALQRVLQARTWLDQHPPSMDAGDVDIEAAEQMAQASQARLAVETQALHDCRLQLGVGEAELAAAQSELDRAEAVLAAPDRAQQQQAAWLALAEARDEAANASGRLAELDSRLASLDLDILRQDVRRLADSEQIQRQRHQNRERELAELGSRLETLGSAGLDEELSDRRRRWAQVTRRVQEMGERARALDHLLDGLQQARARTLQRLHAPLQKHLDRYLRILFPGASVTLDDELVPGEIRREGSRGTECGGLDELSYGAREQVGVLARLAYADLLREAGRPALVMLDDALVHADAGRLAQMKRVLYDAAQRHQILVFTCHPEDWDDLGVAPRPLPQGG